MSCYTTNTGSPDTNSDTAACSASNMVGQPNCSRCQQLFARSNLYCDSD